MAVATKERIIEAGAELFRRQGYAGTGVKSIAAQAEAPFGSLYYFFPGGKDELADAVIRRSGEFYLRLFEAIGDASPDIVTGMSNFFAGAAMTLVNTGYADACPIATVALEVASTNERLRVATADVFESWHAAAQSRLEAAGIARDRARALALQAVATLEGAFILARAARSTEPMDAARELIVGAIRAAVDEAS